MRSRARKTGVGGAAAACAFAAGCHVYDPYLVRDAAADAPPARDASDAPVAPDVPVVPDAVANLDVPVGPDVPPVNPDASLDAMDEAAPDAPLDVVRPADARDGAREAAADVLVDAPPTTLLTNGSFEGTASTWSAGWFFQSVAPGMGTLAQDTMQHADGASSAHITVAAISTSEWHVQLGQGGIAVTAGRTYTISFAARAVPARAMAIVFQRNSTPFTNYYVRTVMLDATWRTFTLVPGTVDETTDAQVVFNTADATGEVWIDRVVLTSP